MKRVVLAITVIVLVAVLGTLLDWRAQHQHGPTVRTAVREAHIHTAAEIQGGPLTPQRKRMFAGLACGRPVVMDDKGELGCPVCPVGSDFALAEIPSTDAGVAASPDPLDAGWSYGSMVFGHFTAANADEALVRTNGCESHANNLGGDVLLRKLGDRWTRVRYVHGGLADEGCQRVGWENGRDALVCHTGDMHQGIATDAAMLVTIEPTAPAQQQDGEGSSFLSVSDDEGDCNEAEEPKTTQSASIDRINLLPGTDGRKDVEVLASIGRIRAPAAHNECPQVTKKPYRLLFRNQGDHFTLLEGLPALQSLAPDECCEVRANVQVQPYRF